MMGAGKSWTAETKMSDEMSDETKMSLLLAPPSVLSARAAVFATAYTLTNECMRACRHPAHTHTHGEREMMMIAFIITLGEIM